MPDFSPFSLPTFGLIKSQHLGKSKLVVSQSFEEIFFFFLLKFPQIHKIGKLCFYKRNQLVPMYTFPSHVINLTDSNFACQTQTKLSTLPTKPAWYRTIEHYHCHALLNSRVCIYICHFANPQGMRLYCMHALTHSVHTYTPSLNFHNSFSFSQRFPPAHRINVSNIFGVMFRNLKFK